jgi:FkbM family methyltransferase
MDPFIDPSLRDYYARTPLVLVDVGVRWGVHERWSGVADHLRVIGFEPDPDEHARLTAQAAQGVTYLRAALAQEAGEVTLNITRSPACSSLLRPNSEFIRSFPDAGRFDIVRAAEVTADSMDAQLAEAGVNDVDFIKLDTQGSELAILRGATRSLESAFGLEVEVEFAALYEGQPLFADVDAHMRDAGFWLFDVRPYYWKREAGKSLGGPRGQVVFGDALYLRTPSSLSELLSALTDAQDVKSKVLRAMSVCLVYGYVDYALELLDANRAVFDTNEAAVIERALRSDVGERWYHRVKGMGRVARALGDLADGMMPLYQGFATSGRRLGNS